MRRITSRRSRWQQGLVATCVDSSHEAWGMRMLELVLPVFLFLGLAVSQEATSPEAAEKAVQAAMSRASSGVYTLS